MSTPSAGWFPDPGGQSGMYRYWDGSAWSAALSPTPHAAPPAQGLVPGSGGARPNPQQSGQGGYGGATGQTGYGGTTGQSGYDGYGGTAGSYRPAPATKSSRGWILALVAVGVVVVVLVGLAVRQISDVAGGGGNTTGPGGQPTQDICPEESTATAEPEPPVQEDPSRVYGGSLSFPELPEPWSAPAPDNRVPFGRDVQNQAAFVEDYPSGSWVASVLVGELIAGDGFFTPEQGAEIVVECVIGVFYGPNTVVQRDDQVSEAATLDGREAWLVESHLTFDIPGLETKGETLIIMIVATGEATASLFYASVPDTSPQFMQPARDSLAQLRVEG